MQALLPDPTSRDANLTAYVAWLEGARGLQFANYDALWDWSVTEIEAFWASIWDFFDVQASQPPGRILARHEMPGAEWFPGVELSYAEHIFRGKRDDQPAIIFASESREPKELTWGELRQMTGAVVAGLRSAGVGRGDHAAGYLPNVPEAVATFLACSSIGAVWSCCSPDFGSAGVLDRFAQIHPKVLVAAASYRHGGRDFDRLDTVSEIAHGLPSLQRVVLLGRAPDLGNFEQATTWADFAQEHPLAELEFLRLPFDHPLWVLYSSGTTGPPKAIVHGQGGICSSISSRCSCISTCNQATDSSGTRRPAG